MDTEDDNHARVFAHELLLDLLIARLIRRDPDLLIAAMNALDGALGVLLDDTTPEADIFKAQVRDRYQRIIKNADEIADAVASTPRPLTLRRRFLNWLERG